MMHKHRNASIMAKSAIAPQALSDEELIARTLSGEKELYEHIIRRYDQRLFKIARSYVNDGDEAEDVVQQAYINAYEHLKSFEGRSKFSTWLTRIVINEALRKTREKDRSLQAGPHFSENGEQYEHQELRSSVSENPAEKVMNDELRIILERTIDGLQTKYRSVFVMREIEGMSIAETSECLGITQSNVKVRLNRAKEKLKESIGRIYQTAEVYHFDLVRCDRIVANVLEKVERY